MLRLAAVVFSAWVLLSGCTGPTYSYSKPDGSPMDFKQDSYACVQDASIDAKRQDNRLYKTCMEARGWTAEAPR
jgi:hypothetical protein